MPPSVLVSDVSGVGRICIWIIKTSVAITKVVFAKIIGRVDVDDVNLPRVSGFQRCENLKVIALDEHVRPFFTVRKRLQGFKQARRRHELAIDALSLPLQVEAARSDAVFRKGYLSFSARRHQAFTYRHGWRYGGAGS